MCSVLYVVGSVMWAVCSILCEVCSMHGMICVVCSAVISTNGLECSDMAILGLTDRAVNLDKSLTSFNPA